MGYAEDVIREILMEEVAQDKVSHAIRRRHEVSFRYDSGDGDPRGKKERITVQPVAYGVTKTGNPCFRAYQVNGSSESAEKGEGFVPGWRMFLLDRVVPNTWRDTGKVFEEPPQYNPNGDKTMSEVYLVANFSGAKQRYERGGLKKYNQARHNAAVEKNPFYDFEKQLKKKNIAPDFVQRNIKDTERSRAERELQWQQASDEANRGNQQSVADMSRQKDFGDGGESETSGPIMKGDSSNAMPQVVKNDMNYSAAMQNGPRYKNDKNTQNIDNNGNEPDEHSGESTEDDDR